MKPKHEPNRVGDMAEHYAITYLWDKGYLVFKNCGCTGPIDIVAIDPKGNIKLIDVKSYKDSRLSSRTAIQKELTLSNVSFISGGSELKNLFTKSAIPFDLKCTEG